MALRRTAVLRSLLLAAAVTFTGLGSPVGAAGTSAASTADLPRSQRVILQLSGTPLLPSAGVAAQSGQDLSALAAILDAQVADAVSLAVQAVPGAVPERSYQRLFHGVALALPEGSGEADLRALRALPGVLAVYEDQPFVPTLYSSAEQIGVPEAWATLGGAAVAGEDTRVAIVDSGIEPSHPMLAPEALGYPTGFPHGDARYATPKVIAARIYVRPSDPPIPGEDTPVPGAHGSPHGTHLAGIVAGVPVTATYLGVAARIAGIAPAAWLMNYRVFYPAASGDEVAYTAEILGAIEDAVADGADVLLAGWTSASGMLPGASPLSLALQAAMEAGCTVVTASGNGGPSLGSASSLPGGDERVITVGAATKPLEIAGDWLDVTAPAPVLPDLTNGKFGRALYGPQISAPVAAQYVGVSSVATDGSPLACAALPGGSLAERIAVARRGTCSFADKTYNAGRAGAVALIVVNTTDELTEMSCSGTHCAPGTIDIPTVLVPSGLGERLLAWATLYPVDAALRLDPSGRPAPSTPDVVADYSARGPAYMRYAKPDLVAPGEAVLSAAPGAPGMYASMSGSSVAAAHVAGAAALVRQAHPSWGHDEVKSALMHSAAGTVRVPDETGLRSALPLESGAGRLDVPAALAAPLELSPAAISIPAVLPGGAVEVTLRLRDTRASGDAVAYALALQGVAGLAMDSVAGVNLSPGQEATRTLQLRVSPTASVGELQTWLTVASTGHTSRVPVWLHVDPPLQTGGILVIDNDFSQFEAYNDYTEYVTRALTTAGRGFTVWDADKRFGQEQTIPDLAELEKHSAVIWVTGDNHHPDGYYTLSTPLTAEDQAILARYLDGGGRLLAAGQNLAEASDTNADADATYGRSALYHQYLGAHWLQGSLFGPDGGTTLPPSGSAAAMGMPATFLSGVGLDLGEAGDGAGNQVSIDEIAPGGLADGQDSGQVFPVLAAVGGQPLGDGTVGVAKACEPTLESPDSACPYRSLYLSLGIEGINDRSDLATRASLVGRLLDWLLDETSVTLDAEHVGAPGEPLVVRAAAVSTLGRPESYRWRYGDRVIETREPQVTLYLESGDWPLTVEAQDSLGHRALASTNLRVFTGGTSTVTVKPPSATAGHTVTYTVRLRHESTAPLAMGVSMPLPASLEYVSVAGGTFSAGVLTWAGEVAAGEERAITLVARVGGSAEGIIPATATFTAGTVAFSRVATLIIGSRMALPLISRNGTP